MLLTVLPSAVFAVAPVAHAADAERIIVTKAQLIGREAAAQDIRVNLLIVDGKFAVVTKDDLVIEPGDVADSLLPARNHGVVVSGTAGEWSTWAVGAFNNWIDSGESFSDISNQLVGRVTWVPAVSEDESNLLHLGLGLRHSDAKQRVRALTEPEFNNAPLYVDTEPLSADDVMTYNLEAYWRKGPWWVGFEYLGSNVESPESGDPYFSGYHLTGSWAVTGETRAYRKRSGTFDPLPVSRQVNQGGWGALELALRYSRLDLTDGTVDGGEMDIISLGAA